MSGLSKCRSRWNLKLCYIMVVPETNKQTVLHAHLDTPREFAPNSLQGFRWFFLCAFFSSLLWPHKEKAFRLPSLLLLNSKGMSVRSLSQAYHKRSHVVPAFLPWPILPILDIPRRSLSLRVNFALLPGPPRCLLQVACPSSICVTCQKNTSFPTSAVAVFMW